MLRFHKAPKYEFRFQDIRLRGAGRAGRVDRQDVAEPQPQARLLLNVAWRLFKARLGTPQG